MESVTAPWHDRNQRTLGFFTSVPYLRIYERPDRLGFMAGQVELYNGDNIKIPASVASGGSRRDRPGRRGQALSAKATLRPYFT